MSFLGNLFGTNTPDQAPQIQYTPPGFNAGGLNASFGAGRNQYTVTPGADRSNLIGGLSSTYGTLADTLGNLRSTVTPGMNDLLQARLNQLNDTARSSIGNLKENLQSRRILGSSFGQDTLTRANAEIGKQRDAIIADNFAKSLDLNQQLLTQEFNARLQQFQTGLNELNLEAGVASDLTGKASATLAANAQAQAKLDQQNLEFNARQNLATLTGVGQFLGFGLGSTTPTGANLLGAAISPAGSNPFNPDGTRNVLAYGFG